MQENTKKTSGLAIAGLILGIIGLLLSFIPVVNLLAILPALLALIFGVVVLFQKNTTKGMAIASLVLAVFTVIVIIVMNIFAASILGQLAEKADDVAKRANGSKTEEILKNDIDVEIGEFSATEDGYGFYKTKLPVRVTNKMQDEASFSISIEALDGNGKRIAESTFFVTYLEPGQTKEAKAFKSAFPEKVEALKTATFKIKKVSRY